jgi:hypothetical protein
MEALQIIKSNIASDSGAASVVFETGRGPLELALKNGKPVAANAPTTLKVQAHETDQRVVLSIRSTSGVDHQIALTADDSRALGERILDAALKCGAYSDSSYCI